MKCSLCVIGTLGRSEGAKEAIVVFDNKSLCADHLPKIVETVRKRDGGRGQETKMQSLTYAMDEIYSLRAAAAHVANQLEDLLKLKSLSVERRRALDIEVARLRACARGEWKLATAGMGSFQEALLSAGASRHLSVPSWESEWKYKQHGEVV